MSAPQTDLEKQEKRHRGPLAGITAVVLFALTLLAVMTFFVVGRGNTPQGAETRIDGRTGGTVEGSQDAGTAGSGGTGSDAATGAGNVATGTPAGTATINRPTQPVPGSSN